MNPSQFPKSLVGKLSRKTVVFCGSNRCPWIWNQTRRNVHVLYAIILNCMRTEESIEVWWEHVQLKLAERFLSVHFITINVLYQTSLRRTADVGPSQKRVRRSKSLFLASWTDPGLSWMSNPGQNPAGEGGGEASEEVGKVVPQESHNSSWPGPSGTNREVWTKAWLKSHERGLMTARISDLCLLPERGRGGESERERDIVTQRRNPDCLFFCLFLSCVISFLFQQQEHLQGDSSKAQRMLGWKPKVSFEVRAGRLQPGIDISIRVRSFSIPSVGRQIFSSVMEDQAKIANGH